MKVEINKEKLWKRKIIENVGILLLGICIFPIMKGIKWLIEEDCYSNCEPVNLTVWTILIVVLYTIFVLVKLWINKLYVDSLEYTVEDDRLQKSYQMIIKTKDSARLQIINSVDIKQTLFDKLFDQFSFEICYGMGDGHYFSFNYLSEEQADKLMNTIRPSGKNILMK